MAAWNITIPVGTEDANTLHTLIQNVKIDIMERMVVTDSEGTVEHIVKDPNATGRHPLSKVDFTCIYADLATLLVARTDPFVKDGTLHYTTDTNKLYVGRETKRGSADPLKYIELVATTDHGEYSGLDIVDPIDDHTRLLLKTGVRVMETDLNIDTGGSFIVETIDAADDQPIRSLHVYKSWFEAHGTDAVDGTFFKDNTFTGIYTTTKNTTEQGFEYDFCIKGLSTRYLGGVILITYSSSQVYNYYQILQLESPNYRWAYSFERSTLQATSRST